MAKFSFDGKSVSISKMNPDNPLTDYSLLGWDEIQDYVHFQLDDSKVFTFGEIYRITNLSMEKYLQCITEEDEINKG
jgi:hypothetical protein